MKRLLYIISGFTMLLLIAGTAQATPEQQAAYQATFNASVYTSSPTIVDRTFCGVFTNLAEAQAAANIDPGLCSPGSALIGTTEAGQYKVLVYVCRIPNDDHHKNVGWSVYDPAWTETDTDGDGIQDEWDMFPDDPDPYEWRVLTEYYDQDGNLVGTLLQIRKNGEIVDYRLSSDMTAEEMDACRAAGNCSAVFDPSNLWQSSDAFKTADQGGGGGGTPVNNKPIRDDEITDADIQDILKDYIVGPAGQPSLNDIQEIPNVDLGQNTSGSETDNEALKKIVSNTKATASNQQTIAAYLKKQNELLGEIRNQGRKTDLTGSGAGTGTGTGSGSGSGIDINVTSDNSDVIQNDNTNRSADQAEANTAQSNFNAVSVEDHYSGITGELEEGEGKDYQLPGELAEENFIMEFFSENPLIMAFESSRFESSGSTPTATLSLGDLGSHKIDLSPLESGFELAGNLLFGLCSIASLIIVVRG